MRGTGLRMLDPGPGGVAGRTRVPPRPRAASGPLHRAGPIQPATVPAKLPRVRVLRGRAGSGPQRGPAGRSAGPLAEARRAVPREPGPPGERSAPGALEAALSLPAPPAPRVDRPGFARTAHWACPALACP